MSQQEADEVEVAEARVAELRPLSHADPPSFAEALSSLGFYLLSSLRAEESLGPMEEAIALWREIAKEKPEYRRALASELSNASLALHALGRSKESYVRARECEEILGVLVQSQPELLQDYLYVLAGLTESLRGCGRPAESVEVARRRVELCRKMTGPSRDLNLVQGVRMLCGALAANGEIDECLRAVREGLEIEALRAQGDGDSSSFDQFANGITRQLALLGRADALKVIGIARIIRRQSFYSVPLRQRAGQLRKDVDSAANIIFVILRNIPARLFWDLVVSGRWDQGVACLEWLAPVRWADRCIRRYMNTHPLDPAEREAQARTRAADLVRSAPAS